MSVENLLATVEARTLISQTLDGCGSLTPTSEGRANKVVERLREEGFQITRKDEPAKEPVRTSLSKKDKATTVDIIRKGVTDAFACGRQAGMIEAVSPNAHITYTTSDHAQRALIALDAAGFEIVRKAVPETAGSPVLVRGIVIKAPKGEPAKSSAAPVQSAFLLLDEEGVSPQLSERDFPAFQSTIIQVPVSGRPAAETLEDIGVPTGRSFVVTVVDGMGRERQVIHREYVKRVGNQGEAA